MFISNTEKYQIRKTIQSLQATISDLLRENETMMQAITDLKYKATSSKRPVIRTLDAPWGYKKNGTPRKRPGRPLHKTPEAQECITPI